MDQSGRLAVAERVADRFQSTPTLTYEQLKFAVAAGLTANAHPAQVQTALTALQRPGPPVEGSQRQEALRSFGRRHNMIVSIAWLGSETRVYR